MPVILATWEAEIWRLAAPGQSGQVVCETPISKTARAKWTGVVAQVVECPEFKPQTLPQYTHTHTTHTHTLYRLQN
jgi:hypothetical protein